MSKRVDSIRQANLGTAGAGATSAPLLHFFREVRRLAAELDAREQSGENGVTEHDA